jgi:hypothetical protein
MFIVIGLAAALFTGNWGWLVAGVVAHVTLNFLFEAWWNS